MSDNTFKDVSGETDAALIAKSFIDKMIPHHEGAVASSLIVMNDLGITESKVRVLAANIVDSQTFEIAKMKSMYAEYLGSEYPASTTHHTMSAIDGLKGDVLGRAYATAMITHHEDAIKMSKDYIKLVDKFKKDSEVKEEGLTVSNNHPALELTYELAKQIIDTQEKEIEQMKTWYK